VSCPSAGLLLPASALLLSLPLAALLMATSLITVVLKRPVCMVAR